MEQAPDVCVFFMWNPSPRSVWTVQKMYNVKRLNRNNNSCRPGNEAVTRTLSGEINIINAPALPHCARRPLFQATCASRGASPLLFERSCKSAIKYESAVFVRMFKPIRRIVSINVVVLSLLQDHPREWDLTNEVQKSLNTTRAVFC